MKLIEQVEVNLDWVDANNLHEHPYPVHKRSVGKPHLSEILRDLAVKAGKLTDGDRDDSMPTAVLLGMGWEMAAARLYPEIWWQPPEIERDGVVGSRDGISYLDLEELGIPDPTGELSGFCIEEFKYTKKSMRKPGGGPDDLKDINSEWLWTQQVLSYMAMDDTNPDPVRLVRFHVLWSRGNYDYKGGGNKERYLRYLLRASDSEVESTWRMIMNHKAQMEGLRTQGQAIELPCVACGGTGKSSRGAQCHPCKGTGERTKN